jgi:hypothetical protein
MRVVDVHGVSRLRPESGRRLCLRRNIRYVCVVSAELVCSVGGPGRFPDVQEPLATTMSQSVKMRADGAQLPLAPNFEVLAICLQSWVFSAMRSS